MIKHLHIAALALLAAGCSTPLDQPTQQTSMRSSCIQASRIQKQEIVSNDEIRFTLAGDEVWVNHLPRTCPGLKGQGGFSWDVSNNTVCPGLQTIIVNDSGTPCTLGEFTRVTTADKAG